MKTTKRKPLKEPKHNTFRALFTFEMQFTFAEDKALRDADTDDGYEPTDEALCELEDELKDYLSQQYPIESIEASADSI